MTTQLERIELAKKEQRDLSSGSYQFGFHDEEAPSFKVDRGLSEDTVRQISQIKDEPDWMLNFRLRGYKQFLRKPVPTWGGDLSTLDFQNIHYFVRASDKQGQTWDDIPAYIKDTFDKLGIPEAEKKFLAGVGAQYDSEVVYHNIREDLAKQGVIFVDTDTAVREYPEIVQQYFGTVIPPGDNKFAGLNTAVWSGGSFVYVPEGVHVEIPLQAYFRINAEAMGQFERTLIIAEKGSYVHYVEGCTAPMYTTESLHSAVVEIIVKEDARVRYTTIQNWANNVY
ncbi:MAG TPA: Fe-S cluster assembly protein SufB, partial [Dehalococcoidia bacterium]|nr:Fe-S cluster assembly protein SufB [Dehalococcoidia bacterium]